jgi:hypothetical protein
VPSLSGHTSLRPQIIPASQCRLNCSTFCRPS